MKSVGLKQFTKKYPYLTAFFIFTCIIDALSTISFNSNTAVTEMNPLGATLLQVGGPYSQLILLSATPIFLLGVTLFGLGRVSGVETMKTVIEYITAAKSIAIFNNISIHAEIYHDKLILILIPLSIIYAYRIMKKLEKELQEKKINRKLPDSIPDF